MVLYITTEKFSKSVIITEEFKFHGFWCKSFKTLSLAVKIHLEQNMQKYVSKSFKGHKMTEATRIEISVSKWQVG